MGPRKLGTKVKGGSFHPLPLLGRLGRTGLGLTSSGSRGQFPPCCLHCLFILLSWVNISSSRAMGRTGIYIQRSILYFRMPGWYEFFVSPAAVSAERQPEALGRALGRSEVPCWQAHCG